GGTSSGGREGPASWPAAISMWLTSSILSAALVPQRTLPGPTRTPACMHGEETGLLRRGALGILTAAVMRLHSHQVCLITHRQTWMFQRPSSSHTPTPVGSLVKGGDY
ncbi:hypothetical protein M9458_055800, partial [Cirrhinus mrigala]